MKKESLPARLFCRLQLSSKVLFEQPSKGVSGFNVVAELSAPEKWPTVVVLSCQESAHPEGRVLEEVTSSLSSAHFNTGAAAAEAAREAERARQCKQEKASVNLCSSYEQSDLPPATWSGHQCLAER